MSSILIVWACLFSVFTFSKVSYAKFLQTFSVRVGGSALSSGNEVLLAKFDKVLLQRFHYDDIRGDTWGAIKADNPNTEIYLYQSGITVFDDQDNYSIVYLNNLGRWNISRAHSMGGLNVDNPSFFLLDSNGNRINYIGYSNRWILDFGLADFRDYFIEGTLHDQSGQNWEADGIFVDNAMSIGSHELTSGPAKYPNNTTWVPAMNSYVNGVSAGIQNGGKKVAFNRCLTYKLDGYNAWIALDQMSTPPNAVLEEGAFAVEWGGGDVQFFAEASWKRQVDLMSLIHNSDVLYLSHSDLDTGQSGVDNYGMAVTFRDILWYAMGSYHIGKNTIDNNSYFGLKESYSRVIWYDEFDHIDLGKVISKYKVTNYGGINIYWREFEKGYVFVNPTKYDVASIALPETCKKLTYSNFESNPDTLSNISTLSLKGHRAAFLLKSDVSALPSPPNDLKIKATNIQ